MSKVLILTAGFGEGHNAAARNLRDGLECISEEVKVEVLDLLEASYGSLNTLARKAYLGMVQYAPAIWGGLYSLLDAPQVSERSLVSFSRLRAALGDILHEAQPDCVVSTFPLYAPIVQDLYREHSERPFRFITVVTDSITVNAAWYRAPSDLYCVPNDATAAVLRQRGVPANQIRALGFPVSPLFAQPPRTPLAEPCYSAPRKILYLISTGKKKAGKAIDLLLDLPRTQLTVTVGRDAELKAKLVERTERYADRVRILGWTNQVAHLMKTHHLVIGKAGGAAVQEAIAAGCPMIVNQVIPGQEEGNAELVRRFDIGAVAERNREVAEKVETAFGSGARVWRRWRENLAKISQPDAALRLAELILEECDAGDRGGRQISLFAPPSASWTNSPPSVTSGGPQLLLCDFHTHTNYSDGKLSVPELIDFYGQRRFDCLCITDHVADPRRMLGKLFRLTNLTLGADQVEEYFEVIERERQRAWRKYRLLVMTGLEFNKDGLTKKSSAHLLGLDLKQPIDPALDLADTIAEIHAQGGLAVASHPHLQKSEWGKNTLYLWEHQDQFAPLIDAWEIANRNNLFSPVSLKRLPYLANSDFHKPKHIYSWKSILRCEKDPEAIKESIRQNDQVGIILYRDGTPLGEANSVASAPPALPLRIPDLIAGHVPVTVDAWPSIPPSREGTRSLG